MFTIAIDTLHQFSHWQVEVVIVCAVCNDIAQLLLKYLCYNMENLFGELTCTDEVLTGVTQEGYLVVIQ